MSEWTPLKKYSLQLDRVLRWGGSHKQTDRYIYIIRDDNGNVVYVGKTGTELKQRLSQHINQRSALGDALHEMMLKGFNTLLQNWSAEVILIQGNVDMAEQHYIQHFQPLFNTLQYEKTPPATHDVGQADDALPIEEPIVESREALLDRIYARALRDPDHPELREKNRTDT